MHPCCADAGRECPGRPGDSHRNPRLAEDHRREELHHCLSRRPNHLHVYLRERLRPGHRQSSRHRRPAAGYRAAAGPAGARGRLFIRWEWERGLDIPAAAEPRPVQQSCGHLHQDPYAQAGSRYLRHHRCDRARRSERHLQAQTRHENPAAASEGQGAARRLHAVEPTHEALTERDQHPGQ